MSDQDWYPGKKTQIPPSSFPADPEPNEPVQQPSHDDDKPESRGHDVALWVV